MFEWDEAKRRATIEKHGIDFLDAAEILNGPHYVLDGNSQVEIRKIAVGWLDGRHIAVVYTLRGEAIRLITARKARRDERERYQALFPGTNPGDEKPH